MKLTPDQLELMEDAASDTLMDLRLDYSGRGMYGKSCVGVTGTLSGLIAFVQRLSGQDGELDRELSRITSDGMGYDSIYYWRGMEAP